MKSNNRIGRLRVTRGAACTLRSESRQKTRHRDFENCGEADQNVHGDILLTAFNLAEVVRMNVGFLRKFFLRKPRRFPRISESVAEDFPVFRTGWHSPERQQLRGNPTTVYSLYFSGRSRGLGGKTFGASPAGAATKQFFKK